MAVSADLGHRCPQAAEGSECSPELVRQIMRTESLVACQPRPFRVTTEADAAAAADMPDLLGRDFTADRPGARFVGDITYIHTWAGFIYLATVIDCYSKKVVGWSIADHMRTELVEAALKNAAATTVIEAGAVFHSDHGSVQLAVYTSDEYATLAGRLGTRLVVAFRVLIQRPMRRLIQPNVEHPASRVGVDVGVRVLATVASSQGQVIERIENPRPLEAALKELRHRGRAARQVVGTRDGWSAKTASVWRMSVANSRV